MFLGSQWKDNFMYSFVYNSFPKALGWFSLVELFKHVLSAKSEKSNSDFVVLISFLTDLESYVQAANQIIMICGI